MFFSVGRRSFSQSTARHSYADTIHNLLIKKDTKVLCQGMTGKTVCALLDWNAIISLRARVHFM